MPEEPDAPPEMTPAQLSAFCARLHARWDAAAVAERLRPLRGARRTGRSARLSKGQKGAVMLALALGHSPELLLLDDPTLGLDVVARDAVFREVIGDLADRGTTVFVTTHDLRAVEGIADRVAILHGGRLALAGRAGGAEGRAGPPARADLRGGGGHPGERRRDRGGALMSRLLAVAARELRERWLLFPGGLRGRLLPARPARLRREPGGLPIVGPDRRRAASARRRRS